MLSFIALALTICFVIYLLHFDRKQSPDISRASWIPTIWMLYIASKPLAVWFPTSRGTPESSPLDRAFLIILILAALCALIGKSFSWSTAIKENPWPIILLGYMLISVLWSNIPNTAIIRWIREFQAVLMAFLVLSELKSHQALECILRRTTYILIPFSVLLIRYFPAYGVQYGRWSGTQMWVGVTLQKNALGRLCLITIFFMFWSLIRRWRGHTTPAWKYQTIMELLILAMAVWLLKGPGITAYSATALIALIIGLLVFLGLALLKKFNLRITAGVLMAIVSIIIILGILTLFTEVSAVGSIAPSVGRNSTLTDRTEVWRALLPIAMKRPFLGHGFGSFWTPRIREMFMISEGHNGYLDVLLDLGFIGILMIMMFLLYSCKKAQRLLIDNFYLGALWLCFIIMAVIHNISESSFSSLTSHLTAVILFLSVCYKNAPPENSQIES